MVEVLNTNGASIAKRAGDTIEVKSVLDLRDFPGDPIQDKIVHDIDLIINDPEIEVVVEVMGGVEPAFTFVKKALEAGKSVCTSNKALVAAHGPELLEMAKERRLNFMFEASVGGGIPIIRPLNQSLTADEITKITGILNGTTNYILTKMSREGISYQEVLKEALALGYYKNREQTAKVFVQNPLNDRYLEPMYRTGDLAYYNERGELCFATRKDFQIKHMGHRIELGEIEAAMDKVPEIVRSCCIFDTVKSKIVAFYEGDIERRPLAKALGQYVPAFMVPNVFRQVESMPLTKNGKIDRKALTAMYQEEKK